jgi:hypothetical protein
MAMAVSDTVDAVSKLTEKVYWAETLGLKTYQTPFETTLNTQGGLGSAFVVAPLTSGMTGAQ